MLDRTIIALPDYMKTSLSELPNWIQYLTLKNSINDLAEYTVIIPNGDVYEVGEEGGEAVIKDLKISFLGKPIYSDLKTDVPNLYVQDGFRNRNIGTGEVGFSIYQLIDPKTQEENGYALLYCMQVKQKKFFNTHLECQLHFKEWDSIKDTVNRNIVDIEKLTQHLNT